MMLNEDYDESNSAKEVIFDSFARKKGDQELVIKEEIRFHNEQYLESSLQEQFLEIICLVFTPDD